MPKAFDPGRVRPGGPSFVSSASSEERSARADPTKSGTKENRLGDYLKDRRTKIDPAAMGYSMKRRRTPGLRREEVAQRAHVSATWYTWLEQGRGGAPSADVLDRIAGALMLTDVEREHLFLLGLGRPPEAKFAAPQGISPRLQRVLDALEAIPAFVKTSTWDILAWNRVAEVLFGYSADGTMELNILRRIFLDPAARAANPHWDDMARFCVAAFRADAVRAGAHEAIMSLVNELCVRSADFKAMWNSNDVRSHGEGTKHLRHPIVGALAVEYSAFAVDGRVDLSMVIYNPATAADAAKIRKLLQRSPKLKKTALIKRRKLARV